VSNSNSLPLSGVDAAILVGGLGTRLRGVVDDVPKPFAPVLGRPFLFYILDMLALRGARSVTLCSGYMAEFVREKTGTEWLGMPIHHSVETEPLGTAGALANAKNFLTSPRVLVMNGDTWLEPDFEAFLETAERCDFCISAAKVPDASRYGTLETALDGRLLAFREKSPTPAPGLINAGMYLLSREILATLPQKRTSLETEILPGLAAAGRVQVFENASPFLDIGIPSDYAAAADFFVRLDIAPVAMFPDFPDMTHAAVKLGTCIVIFDENRRVVLERRSDCGWWCLPGGRVDPGETVLSTALREAEEETGLRVEPTSFLGLFSDPCRRTVRYPDNGDIRQLIDATILAKPIGGRLAASHESLDVRWFAPGELPLNTVPPVIEILRAAYSQTNSSLLR
jgi:dTDP-glucose pyrophosphorylase/8-oxo-dGTP pyrophosphatase MutT (NUDIX family)